jgi:hypothetical protein
MKYHIHVNKITEVACVDVEATSEEEALEMVKWAPIDFKFKFKALKEHPLHKDTEQLFQCDVVSEQEINSQRKKEITITDTDGSKNKLGRNNFFKCAFKDDNTKINENRHKEILNDLKLGA